MTQGDLPPLPPQHPGGFIWEPHAGRMRIVTDAEWGALADDLLPAVREAAATLANPLIRGANIHPLIVERAARLTELLSGEMAEVAARVPRVYMASLWLAEKYDTDRKLRGANDPMGEPLSDEMRAALVDLMAVLPSFVRQFPKVLQIEADNAAFFADEAQPGPAERLIDGAQEEEVIDAADAAVLRDGLQGGGGDGPFHLRGPKASIFSLRNLVIGAVGAVALSVGHGFLGEIGAALSRGFGVPEKVEAWAAARREDMEHLFSTAPADVQHALSIHLDALGKAPPVQPPEPLTQKHRTWIVDPDPAKGDFTLIQPAIDAADPGDRIVVREGTYRESLRLSKALEIIGEGDVERIVVTTGKGSALQVDAPLARVSGLRLRRQVGGSDHGVWITGGAVELDDCVVESWSLACVAINGGGTTPTLRRCHLRNGAQGGLFVYEGAQVQAEECRFSGNTHAGVEVKGEATRATLRRCRAENGKVGGYVFHEGAGGLLDECEASGNAFSGVKISTAADPLLRDCILRDNKESGVFVLAGGRGRIDGGQITGNGSAGVEVRGGGNPMVTGCTITGNGYEAIWISDATSTGTFRNNDLRGNARGPWNIAEGAKVIDEGNLT